MRILGIDPGTGITGWGIVDKDYNRLTVVDYGCIRTPANSLNQKRLCDIYDGLLLLLQEYQPDEMAIEELFYNRNTTTVISVGQARGVLILAAAQRGVPIFEYTPLQIKQAVTGYGKAEKRQPFPSQTTPPTLWRWLFATATGNRPTIGRAAKII